MPKFIIKHGCCYIPPIENASSTTCQVYSNPEFSNLVPSDPFCGKGKSSPEFNQERNVISWAHLDYTPEKSSQMSVPSPSTKENCTQTAKDQNLITLYGYERELGGFTNCLREENVSDGSIYKPTTNKACKISRSAKMLDCLSTCLWKCSAWCQ